MTALSIVQDASLRIGVPYPSELFAGTSRALVELKATLLDCARMVAYDTGHDWTALKTLNTFTGNGTDLAFDMPADYQRMLKKATVWPSDNPYTPMIHYTDTDEWLGMLSQAFPPLSGAWTLIGDQMHIRVGGSSSPLGTGVTAQFYYLTKKYARNAGGTAIAAFSADDDTYRLDERLLTLAVIYRWKQAHGQDYAEELSDYGNALAERIGSDKGSNIFAVGGRTTTALDLGWAYPGVLGP
jgi:hypothetical protein